MIFSTKAGFPQDHERPQLDKVDHRVIIVLSLMLMLATFIFYQQGVL